MGTSVSVAKYMSAPTNEARKLAPSELPPTTPATHDEGTSPASVPGRPISQPETRIPPSRRGVICLAKAQVAWTHCPSSSFEYQRRHHPEECHEERRGERPVHAVDRGEEAHRLVRRAPVGEDEDRHHGRRGTLASCHPFLGPSSSAAAAAKGSAPFSLPLGLLAPEKERHQDSHDHREEHRSDCPCQAELQAEDTRGQDHREDVDRRARVEEGRCRAEAGSAPVDRGEERQHGAGATARTLPETDATP